MQLYKISELYQQILSLDELSRDDLDMLDQVAEDFNKKAIAIASIVRNTQSDCDILEAEIDLLKKRLQTKKRKVDSLKDYLRTEFDQCKINKVESPLFDITLRASPCKLNILDKDQIPSEYFVKKEIVSIDEQTIKQKLKNKEEVPGCELIQNNHIRINIYQGDASKA